MSLHFAPSFDRRCPCGTALCAILLALPARTLAQESDGADSEVAVPEPSSVPLVDPSLAGPAEIFAPAGALEIELLERGTRVPLANFGVTIMPAPGEQAPIAPGGDDALTDWTNNTGTVHFERLVPGRWTIRADEGGYEALSVDERVEGGMVTRVRLYVERERFDAYVSTTTRSTAEPEVTRRSIPEEQIRTMPGTSGDALRVVLSLPGVARTPYDFDAIIIRGSESDDNAYLLDGLPLPLLYHFGGLRAVVPSEILSGMELVPGGFGAPYGDATGGLVLARAGRADSDRAGGHVDLNLYDGGVFVAGPLGERVTFQLGARRSWVDAVLSQVEMPDWTVTTAPRYVDAQLRLSHRSQRGVRTSLFALVSDDRFAVIEQDDRDTPPNLRGGAESHRAFHSVRLHRVSHPSDDLSRDTGVQLLHRLEFFDLGGRFGEIESWSADLRDETRWQVSETVELAGGVTGTVGEVDASARMPILEAEGETGGRYDDGEVIEGEIEQTVLDGAVFAETSWEPAEGVRLVPGLRLSGWSQHDAVGVEPRMSASWGVTEAWTLRSSGGVYHRPLSITELSSAYGNPSLPPERAYHASLGSSVEVAPGLTLEVDGYYKSLDTLASPTEAMEMRDGELVPQRLSADGRGRAYGAELMLRRDSSDRFWGWIAWTVGRSERLDAGAESWRLFDSDQTHVLTLVGSYRLPANWTVGARMRAVTGSPETPIVGSTWDSDGSAWIPIPGEANSERLPTFFQLDLRVDRRWVFDLWSLTAYLDIQNATNRRNVESYNYADDWSERASIGGLPIFPAFGIRGEY